MSQRIGDQWGETPDMVTLAAPFNLQPDYGIHRLVKISSYCLSISLIRRPFASMPQSVWLHPRLRLIRSAGFIF